MVRGEENGGVGGERSGASVQPENSGSLAAEPDDANSEEEEPEHPRKRGRNRNMTSDEKLISSHQGVLRVCKRICTRS